MTTILKFRSQLILKDGAELTITTSNDIRDIGWKMATIHLREYGNCDLSNSVRVELGERLSSAVINAKRTWDQHTLSIGGSYQGTDEQFVLHYDISKSKQEE